MEAGRGKVGMAFQRPWRGWLVTGRCCLVLTSFFLVFVDHQSTVTFWLGSRVGTLRDRVLVLGYPLVQTDCFKEEKEEAQRGQVIDQSHTAGLEA